MTASCLLDMRKPTAGCPFNPHFPFFCGTGAPMINQMNAAELALTFCPSMYMDNAIICMTVERRYRCRKKVEIVNNNFL